VLTEHGLVCSLPAPARHFQVVHLLSEKFGHQDRGMDTQGFLLSDGTFCRRVQAKRIAERAGQLLPRAMKLRELYSEDVW